jgi:hypothetical protein
MKGLCLPLVIYIVLCVIGVVTNILMQGIIKKNINYVILFSNILMNILFGVLMYVLCLNGYSGISWFILLFPIIMGVVFFIMLTGSLIFLDKISKKLKIKHKSEKQ